MEKYYVYLESICGTELIATTSDKKEAEKIRQDRMAGWRPGYQWDVVITTKKKKEVNYWD